MGVLVMLLAAAGIALSMVTQRYALSYPEPEVPFLWKWKLSRNKVWFVGLIIYGAANGLQAFALNLGPLFVLGGVFTLLLVFNLIFARLMLREAITLMKVAGALSIVVGVIVAIFSVPDDVKTSFTPSDIEALFARSAGASYFALLLFLLATTAVSIAYYEYRYPPAVDLGNPPAKNKISPTQTSSTTTSKLESAKSRVHPGAGSEDEGELSARHGNAQLPDMAVGSESLARNNSPPPPWLDRVMSIAYPMSLGIDEGLAQLTIRAWMAIVSSCGKNGVSCNHWTLYVNIVLWIFFSLACVPYLRVVFRRYETTMALPIEYGTMNALATCSGLLFYEEGATAAPWQLSLAIISLALVCLGIGIGQLSCAADPLIGRTVAGVLRSTSTPSCCHQRPDPDASGPDWQLNA